MKLAMYRAIKCGTEYNARKPPTIVAFVIIIRVAHRHFSCRRAKATNVSESLTPRSLSGGPIRRRSVLPIGVHCNSSHAGPCLSARQYTSRRALHSDISWRTR